MPLINIQSFILLEVMIIAKIVDIIVT